MDVESNVTEDVEGVADVVVVVVVQRLEYMVGRKDWAVLVGGCGVLLRGEAAVVGSSRHLGGREELAAPPDNKGS